MRSKLFLLLSISLVVMFMGSIVGCEQLGLKGPTTYQPSTPRTLKMSREWEGSGIKTTETFVIEEVPWAVSWANNPEDDPTGETIPSGVLQIMVYDVTNPATPVSLVAHSAEQSSDLSYVHQAGTFYLIISGPYTKWQVQVWE